MNRETREIRYYMGRHKICIMHKNKKKNIIMHMESGYVGNKREGYKNVEPGEYDIVLPRHCEYTNWRKESD